jgi:hypothetical protein
MPTDRDLLTLSVTAAEDYFDSRQQMTQTIALGTAVATSTSITKQWTTEDALLLNYRVNTLKEDVDRVVSETQNKDLDDEVNELAKLDPKDLLLELTKVYAFAWTDIARLVGISVPALRKWRTGGSPSTESLIALCRLVAFVRKLSDGTVKRPAAWMRVPIVEGYLVTPTDLYEAGMVIDLLDFAWGERNGDRYQLLSKFDPEWSAHYKSEYESFVDSEGVVGLRRRSDSES